MAGPQLANCAPALATIVCVATFVIGPITLTVYKYAAFLFLITLHTIILCQCAPCAHHEIFCHFCIAQARCVALVLATWLYGYLVFADSGSGPRAQSAT